MPSPIFLILRSADRRVSKDATRQCHSTWPMAEPATALPKPARRRPTALSPFRFGMFRAVWIGTLSANFGQWVQSVGAAWLMTSIAPSPDMVALVQAAAALPTLAFALIGGVLADLLDRRKVFIAGQSVMLAAAAVLALCGQLGLLTPWLLLWFREKRPVSMLASLKRWSTLTSNWCALLVLPFVPIQLFSGLYCGVPTPTFGIGKYCIILSATGSIRLPGRAGS